MPIQSKCKYNTCSIGCLTKPLGNALGLASRYSHPASIKISISGSGGRSVAKWLPISYSMDSGKQKISNKKAALKFISISKHNNIAKGKPIKSILLVIQANHADKAVTPPKA